MDKKQVSGGGISFVGVLTCVFIALKLMGHIAWSWWWVLSPIWIGPAVALVILFFAFIIGVIISGGKDED